MTAEPRSRRALEAQPTGSGAILETLSVPNAVIDSGPWKHHDLAGLGDWVFSSLSELAKRYRLTSFVSSGHGSGGVLVGDDPDAGDGYLARLRLGPGVWHVAVGAIGHSSVSADLVLVG